MGIITSRKTQKSIPMETVDSSAVFYGLVGAGSALFLSAIGAAVGSAKSASAQQSNDTPSMSIQETTFSKKTFVSFIPIIIAGVLAIYGLIYAVIVLQATTAADYSTNRGYAQLVGGLTLGLCCLASGVAVGSVAKSGQRAIQKENGSPAKMIINLVYCEALGLYGLIFGLIASSTF